MGDIWDKRYRTKSTPVLDNGTYTKIQGAIVQLIYQDIQEGNFFSIYDDVQELLDLLCKGVGAIKPILPESKQQELLDEVQVFLENNDVYIKGKRLKELSREFFDFVFDFVRLESVMRIFTLSGVNTKMTLDPLTTKEIRAVLKWEKEVRNGISRYLYMPEECDPARAYRWPLDASKAEYFWEIYDGILKRYGIRYSADERYANAYNHLKSVNYFSAGTGGRK